MASACAASILASPCAAPSSAPSLGSCRPSPSPRPSSRGGSAPAQPGGPCRGGEQRSRGGASAAAAASLAPRCTPRLRASTPSPLRCLLRGTPLPSPGPCPCPSPSLSPTRARAPVQCSLAGGQEVAVAGALFTLATAAVVPLYTLMLVAPKSPLTKRVMRSPVPWVLLGLLYLYLLGLSWTPLTLPSMFSSKYWLPELPGIARMFSSPLTVASAWIHLLALDLYAARSVYFEGLQQGIETRHSLCLCLLFAPLGVLCHALTQALVLAWRSQQGSVHSHSYSDFESTEEQLP